MTNTKNTFLRMSRSWWIAFLAILVVGTAASALLAADDSAPAQSPIVEPDGSPVVEQKDNAFMKLVKSTGLYALAQGFIELGGGTPSPVPEMGFRPKKNVEKEKPLLPDGVGKVVMIAVSLLLIWLAIKKGFEPLLLLPIGFGGILANIPVEHIAGPDGSSASSSASAFPTASSPCSFSWGWVP